MTRAAQDLRATDAKVVDVALRYGYDSPTAFARAFRRVHGASPNDARRPQTKLTLYPRLVFTLSVKGEEAMDYRIIEQGAFRVVGIPSDNGTWEVEDAGEKAVDYWEKLGPRVHEILDLVDRSRAGWAARCSVLPRRRVRLLHGLRRDEPPVPRGHGGAHRGSGHPTRCSNAWGPCPRRCASCGTVS